MTHQMIYSMHKGYPHILYHITNICIRAVKQFFITLITAINFFKSHINCVLTHIVKYTMSLPQAVQKWPNRMRCSWEQLYGVRTIRTLDCSYPGPFVL